MDTVGECSEEWRAWNEWRGYRFCVLHGLLQDLGRHRVWQSERDHFEWRFGDRRHVQVLEAGGCDVECCFSERCRQYSGSFVVGDQWDRPELAPRRYGHR